MKNRYQWDDEYKKSIIFCINNYFENERLIFFEGNLYHFSKEKELIKKVEKEDFVYAEFQKHKSIYKKI